MIQFCPRCRRANPEQASFCHFDGSLLRQGATPAVASGQLLQAFVFPSGRRCETFDELVQGCYAEWDDARSMLFDGAFAGFLSGMGRGDLARAAREAQGIPDHDIALTNFIASLPASRTQGPRLGLTPRRLVIGQLHVGERQQRQIRIQNEGQGTLQGKITIPDGIDWLQISGAGDHRTFPVQTTREQVVNVLVDTSRLVAGQNYAGKLVVVTSGGIAEVPIRLDLAARPFALAPYQGATSPHELARKMRDNPRPAVLLLESGEVAKWFASNGWAYPVVGTAAPGLAAVQQFFEELGLAKAPHVQISDQEVRLFCKVPGEPQGQVTLRSPAKKLVYGRAESDSPWLIVTTPSVSGQVQTTISFTVDPAQLPENRTYEGHLRVVANAGQAFQVRVLVEVTGNTRSWFGSRKTPTPAPTSSPSPTLEPVPQTIPPPPVPGKPPSETLPTWVPLQKTPSNDGVKKKTPTSRSSTEPIEELAVGGWMQTVIVGAFVGLLGRVAMVAPADLFARILRNPVLNPVPGSLQAWLTMPLADDGFLREFVMVTWWIGAVVGVWFVWRSGGKWPDLLCGFLAGTVAGLGISATLGSCLVLGDGVARIVLSGLLGSRELPAMAATPLWILTTSCCWLILGAGVGLVLGLTGKVGKSLLGTLASPLTGLLRLCGMDKSADFFALRVE